MQKPPFLHLSHRWALLCMALFMAAISGVLLVQPAFAATNTFSNTGSITIPNTGAANPYPSTISVSGIPGTITDVNVTIRGISHTYAGDIDILLVGPNGQNVMLMSDAGEGGYSISNLNFTFDSDASTSLPNSSSLSSGTYRPTNWDPYSGDTIFYPGPGQGSYGTLLDVFDGVNPNGAWSLYVVDDGYPDSGSISGGWSLTLTTVAAPTITSAASINVVNGTSFSHTFAAFGDPTPTLSYVPGTLPAGVSLVGDVLSGTPTVPGVYTIDVTATNGVSPDATQTFTLTVTGDAPSIDSAASASVLATTSFSHTFAASGNPAPVLSYSAANLPSGVSLVGDTLSGTPTVPGSYSIEVTASNGILPNAVQTFAITVNGDAPVITSVEMIYVGQGEFVAHTFRAAGRPTPTLSYSIINLPPGITLTGDFLTGYPQLSGTFGITVTAANGVNPNDVQYFVLSVGALPEAPPSPFAEDVNFLENTAVRTGVPVSLFDAILVRTMYQYGHSTQWLGNDMYSAGSVGIQGVVNLGVQQAIDLSSGNGDTYWEGGATFCLDGAGPLIWMSAANTPRHAEIIGSYTVPEFPGYTCATLFEPGTLVLVSHLPE